MSDRSQKPVEPLTSESLVEKIKRAGARAALLREIGDRLWEARLALEEAEAEKDRCKDFATRIQRALKALSEAKLLHGAWCGALSSKNSNVIEQLRAFGTVGQPATTVLAMAYADNALLRAALDEADDLLCCAEASEDLEGATAEEWQEQTDAWRARNGFGNGTADETESSNG